MARYGQLHPAESQQHLPQDPLLQGLAEFRYRLRSFLQFSEQVAQDHGLRPRQHQLLLQVAGLPDDRVATINYLATRLGLRQNSVVELADRSVAQGLVRRTEDPSDHRRVVLAMTDKGRRVIDALSASHARELDELAPQLLRALERVKMARGAADDALASQQDSKQKLEATAWGPESATVTRKPASTPRTRRVH